MCARWAEFDPCFVSIPGGSDTLGHGIFERAEGFQRERIRAGNRTDGSRAILETVEDRTERRGIRFLSGRMHRETCEIEICRKTATGPSTQQASRLALLRMTAQYRCNFLQGAGNDSGRKLRFEFALRTIMEKSDALEAIMRKG